MSSLGDLYFALGLDDKQFNSAIEEAKKKVTELGGKVSVGVTVDPEAVRESLSKLNSGKISIKADTSELDALQKRIDELNKQIEASSRKSYGWNEKNPTADLIIDRNEAQRKLDELRKTIDASTKEIEGKAPKIKVSLELTKTEINRIKTELKTSLNNAGVDININPKISKKALSSAVKVALDGITQKVEVTPVVAKKGLKKLEMEVNKSVLKNSVKAALKNEVFTAKLKLVVEKAEVQEAIRAAFAQQGMVWNTTASDVRTAKMQQIQAKTRSQELIDQEKLNQLRNKGIDEAQKRQDKLDSGMKHTFGIAKQLANQIVNAFSIYTLERFVTSLYTIGGEFQKQQIALQNMIGDMDKANAVFERMKDLSVKSPFTFSELASYTKQMSAYGVEYEELYNTTKRLADISAGVGVDMSRLILAYGQVRSAEVLRGQELRQFTEAGIPLVKELAKRLEEVRGKSVAVGEVFDAISKRQISFDMVKDVLFDMTDPGGRFFETQEKLAESLAGKWANLKDAWDIMLADIAKGNNTVLSGLAEMLTSITRNWEYWLPLISGITAALVTFSLALAAATIKQWYLNSAVLANPYVAAAAAVVGLATAIYGYASGAESAADAAERLNTELEKEVQILEENKSSADGYLDILKETTDKEEEKLKLQQKQQVAFNALVNMYPDLLRGYTLEQMSLEKILELKKDIAKATSSQITASYDKNINDLKEIYDKAKLEADTKESRHHYAVNYGSALDRLLMPSAEEVRQAQSEASMAYIKWQEAIEAKKQYEEESKRNKSSLELTPDSSLADYIKLYGEIGKAVKLIRGAGINSELAKPKNNDIIEYSEALRKALQEQKNIMKDFAPDTDTYQNAEKYATVYESAIKAIGGVLESSGGSKDSVAELWKSRSDELQKAIDLYNKWLSVEGADKASKRVREMDEFSSLFNGDYGFSLDLDNPTAAIEYIQQRLDKAQEEQRELYIKLGVKIDDENLKIAKERLKGSIEEIDKYIKKTSENWDLYKRLYKATGNKSLAASMSFGVSEALETEADYYKNEILKKMEEMKMTISFNDLISMDNGTLERNGFQGLTNLIKAYNDATQRFKKDTLNTFAEIIEASKDFTQQISDAQDELQRNLNAIYGSSLPYEEKKRYEDQIYANYEEKVAEINFEQFKKSSDWVKIFDDLDRVSSETIQHMIDEISEFSEKGIESEKVLKEVTKSLRKLREEALKRNPLLAFSTGISIDLGKLNEEISRLKKEREKAFKDNDIELYLKLSDEIRQKKDSRKVIYGDYDKAMDYVFQRLSEYANALNEVTGLLEKFGNEGLANLANIVNSAISGMQSGMTIGKVFGGAGGVVGGFLGTAVGVMGGLVEAGQKAVELEQERSQIVVDRLEKVASLLKDSIAESLTGLYNSTLDATSRMEMMQLKEKYDYAESYFKGKGQQIDPNSSYVALLDTAHFSWDVNKYLLYSKKTHDAINQALESDNEYMAAYASMLAQRDELIYQKANYSNKDEDKVKAYRQDKQLEIEKLNAEISQLSKDMMSSLYSIDFKDWAGQFADAIVNAWASGEDAAKAYKDTVADVMRNVATSVAQQLIIGKYLEEQLPKFMDQFIANNGIMDDSMFSSLTNIVSGVEDRIDLTQQFLDEWEKILNEKGYSMKMDNGGTSGGLSKGIESVTEDTANLLASYLNSIRQDVSIKRTLIEQLIVEDIPQMSIIAQAQLTQLNIIAANTLRNADAADRIYDLVNRVVDKSGNRLKV